MQAAKDLAKLHISADLSEPEISTKISLTALHALKIFKKNLSGTLSVSNNLNLDQDGQTKIKLFGAV